MTDAPDPGLTDLIAAHREVMRWNDFAYPPLSTTPYRATSVTEMVNCSCGESMTVDSFPAHVALVVEQHTNRRIAELEAEYGHLLARNEHLAQRLRVRIEDARRATSDRNEWKATALDARATADEYRDHAAAMVKRAEKAEAYISRILDVLADPLATTHAAMKLQLAPKLRPLPDLGMHQITASQLATNGMDGNPIYQSDHIGRNIAVRANGALLAGKLCSVSDSATYPLLVLEIGYHKVAVHPTHPITVAPEGYQLTMVARPKPEGEQR